MKQLDIDNSEKVCVFRIGDDWFGVPALSVRSITPRPQISDVPYSDPTLAGLCHVHNEFIPVFSLLALIQAHYQSTNDGQQQLLIINGQQGPWGLLVDHVVALSQLDISLAPYDEGSEKWSTISQGTATFREQVIQIIDPAALYQYGSHLIEMFWQGALESSDGDVFNNTVQHSEANQEPTLTEATGN